MNMKEKEKREKGIWMNRKVERKRNIDVEERGQKGILKGRKGIGIKRNGGRE